MGKPDSCETMGVLMVVTTLASAMAVEQPAFRPLLREGDFELRDYPGLVATEVTVAGDQKEAASKGFRLLASPFFVPTNSRSAGR